MSETTPIPEGVRGWNWGAFLVPPLWAGIYRLYLLSILTSLPILNLLLAIPMGLRGNEWAWRKGRWESVEAFHRAQRKTTVIALWFWVIYLPILAYYGVHYLQDQNRR